MDKRTQKQIDELIEAVEASIERLTEIRMTSTTEPDFEDWTRRIEFRRGVRAAARAIRAADKHGLDGGLVGLAEAFADRTADHMESDANRGGEDDCPAGAQDDYNRGF
jgi:hypothetical protein